MKTLLKVSSLCLLALLLGCPRGHYRIGVDTRIHDHDRDHDRDRDRDRDHDRDRDRDRDRHRDRDRVYPQAIVYGVTVEVRAPTYYEKIRIQNLVDDLDFAGQPMVSWWRIVVLPRAEWEDALRYYHLEGRTASAFTIMGQNETLISEDYMLYHGSYQVRFTLAHEAAHLILNGGTEDQANEIARILTKKFNDSLADERD
jgi:hypothetical protein